MGKYAVRIGFEIRQFCSGHCLEEFKNKKFCRHCQVNLTNEDSIVRTPIDAKESIVYVCIVILIHFTSENGNQNWTSNRHLSWFFRRNSVHKIVQKPISYCVVIQKFLHQIYTIFVLCALVRNRSKSKWSKIQILFHYAVIYASKRSDLLTAWKKSVRFKKIILIFL